MEMKVLIICVLFSLITVTQCSEGTMHPVNHTNCDKIPKYEGRLTGVSVSSPLDAKGNIVLKEGTNVTVSFSFKLDKGPVTSATSVVYGVIGGVPVPFTLGNPNACKDSGLKCPLAPGNSYNYDATVPVPKSVPEMRLVIKWKVVDQNSNTVWCTYLPAHIE